MKVFESFWEWKAFKKANLSEKTIGFVPTMGNLHQGHLSLCATSQNYNDVTVVSIFVNPTQFNDASDYDAYPRTLQNDLALLEQQGVDYCILPNQSEVYADNYRYQIHETKISKLLEGEFRPGHFNGMLTIVLKLLLGIAPTRAYFGEKDYQQYLLVKDMVESFFMDCEIIACPIIRETSLLPFSSRNSRLLPAERVIADQVAGIFNAKELTIDEIRQQLLDLGLEIDYLEEQFNRRLMAVRVGKIRLLDNYAIG
jgi:pantoate--beta-alanine ligase